MSDDLTKRLAEAVERAGDASSHIRGWRCTICTRGFVSQVAHRRYPLMPGHGGMCSAQWKRTKAARPINVNLPKAEFWLRERCDFFTVTFEPETLRPADKWRAHWALKIRFKTTQGYAPGEQTARAEAAIAAINAIQENTP